MPRKARKTQYQFGSAAGAEEIAKFGSLAAGAEVYTTDPEVIQDLVQYDQGWMGAAIGMSPAVEDRNALDYLFAYQLQYLLQAGIPEWDAETEYFTGQVVSQGDQYGFQYVSLADSNLNHAVTDTNWWRKINGQVTSTKTSSFTLTAADNGCIILCNTTGGAFNITLPTGGAAKNYSFTVKDANGTFSTNAVTIVRAGSEAIEGTASNYTLNRNGRATTFVCDGTHWHIVSNTVDSYRSVGETIGEAVQNLSGSSATGLNIVGNTASRYSALIQQKITTAGVSFGLLLSGGTNSTDAAMHIVTAGNVDLARFRGDKVLEMYGGGIKFPATQVASADANVLDDYEEGTFTPSLSFNTAGTSSFTYGTREGRYTKTGDTVHVWIRVSLSAFSKGTASGNLFVTGLPFTALTGNNTLSVLSLTMENWAYGASTIPILYIGSNTASAVFQAQTSGASAAIIADPSATSFFAATGIYKTAS